MTSAQKIIKYLAIAFALFIIINIFYGIYQLGYTVIGYVSNDSKSINIEEYSSDTNILSISLKSSKLTIKKGDNLEIENNIKYIVVNQDNNKLSIKEKSHFGSFSKNEVVIYVPDDLLFDKVYISNGAGTIGIDNISTKELNLELGAGKISIDKLYVENEANIDSGAGEVIIDNAYIFNLDLDVGVGKFTLNSVLRGENDIDAGIGELNLNLLDNESNYKIFADKGIGSLKINDKNYSDKTIYGSGDNTIDIDGGIGSINIDFKDLIFVD